MPRLIDAGELMRVIPSEEINARMAVYYSPTVEAITVEWLEKKVDEYIELGLNSVAKELRVIIDEWERENAKID